MKAISKRIMLFMLVITSIVSNAQDTIYFKDKSVVSAKLSEINITEIKYQRFDNLNGPVYTTSKSDVEKIKYNNGKVDTIHSKIEKFKEVKKPNSIKLKPELVLVGDKIYCDDEILGKLKTRQLMASHSLSENQIKLIEDVNKVGLYKNNYNALGTGLFVTGFAVPVVATFGALSASFSNSNYDKGIETIVAGAVVGAILRIAGHTVFKMGKNKSKAKKIELLEKYNQNEIIY